MQFLIWGGALVTLLGVAGFLLIAVKLGTAKRETDNDEELRARIQRLVPLNLAALFVSVLGLMMVMIGIVLN